MIKFLFTTKTTTNICLTLSSTLQSENQKYKVPLHICYTSRNSTTVITPVKSKERRKVCATQQACFFSLNYINVSDDYCPLDKKNLRTKDTHQFMTFYLTLSRKRNISRQYTNYRLRNHQIFPKLCHFYDFQFWFPNIFFNYTAELIYPKC